MKKKINKKKKNINYNKIFMRTLYVLGILELIFIPILYVSEVKGKFGIILFLVLTTILTGLIIFISRVCLKDYNLKKDKIIEKLKY